MIINPQVFLEEGKYEVKMKKIMNTINDDLNLDEFDNETNINFIYLDFHCFSYASTFSSIFFIIKSSSISVILIHFTQISFSFLLFY